MPSRAEPCLRCYPTQLFDRKAPLQPGQCAISLHLRIPLVCEQCWVYAAEGKMIGLYEIWKKRPFFSSFFPTPIPVAISGVLSCLFVHYLCIIRQTIIPLCFASVVQMLPGNESPQRPVKGRCYYQPAIHRQSNREESITFKKSSAERKRLFLNGHLQDTETRPFYEDSEDFLK